MIKKIIAFLLEKKIDFAVKKKINKMAKQLILKKDVSNVTKTNYNSKWNNLKKSFSPKALSIFYSINDIESDCYVPENIYYTKVEPVLNNRTFAMAYADKNFYEKYVPAFAHLFPKAVLRGINGVFMKSDYSEVSHKELLEVFVPKTYYIIKPATETSGGNLVKKISYSDNILLIDNTEIPEKVFISQLNDIYSGSFVIQEKIAQHRWFEEFNESSLNTVRIYTYRSVENEEINILSSVLRFGKQGSLVDNQAAGGLTCGISLEGYLNDFICDKYGRIEYSDAIMKNKAGTLVPGFEEMTALCKRIAPHWNYHRLLGFDFCYTNKNEVKLLEINCKNIEINFLQMNNGPLFGKFTDEIIKYCIGRRKSVVLDFYI